MIMSVWPAERTHAPRRIQGPSVPQRPFGSSVEREHDEGRLAANVIAHGYSSTTSAAGHERRSAMSAICPLIT
jgi:hypothetical protein